MKTLLVLKKELKCLTAYFYTGLILEYFHRFDDQLNSKYRYRIAKESARRSLKKRHYECRESWCKSIFIWIPRAENNSKSIKSSFPQPDLRKTNNVHNKGIAQMRPVIHPLRSPPRRVVWSHSPLTSLTPLDYHRLHLKVPERDIVWCPFHWKVCSAGALFPIRVCWPTIIYER